jgi:hypothetical protein
MPIKFFELEPWYIIHIFMNVAFLFGAFYLGQKFFNLSNLSIPLMFVFWGVALYLGDRLTHFILQKD